MPDTDPRTALAAHLTTRLAVGRDEGRAQAQRALYGHATDAWRSRTSPPPVLTPMADRAFGAIMGSAAGDALGAAYELGAPMASSAPVVFGAGRVWAKGEWTDDTAMGVPILEAVARGEDLGDDSVLGRIVRRWLEWAADPKDIGRLTRHVLDRVRAMDVAGMSDAEVARACRAVAKEAHETHGQSAGNGSLMRTGPVALGYLAPDEDLATAARRVGELTHADPDASDACVIWTLAIRHAITSGNLDIGVGLAALPDQRRELWRQRIDAAEQIAHPSDVPGKNSWVVATLQAAWCAIRTSTDLQSTLEQAVRAGHDTDTVAAVAGALAGARYGAAQVPREWYGHLHGWPGIGARELGEMVQLAVGG